MDSKEHWKSFVRSKTLASIASVLASVLVLWIAMWYYDGLDVTLFGYLTGTYYKPYYHLPFIFEVFCFVEICAVATFLSAVRLKITVKVPSIVFYGSICLTIISVFLTPLIWDFQKHLRILPLTVFTALLCMISTHVGLKVWPFLREGGQRNITMDEYLRY